MFVKRSDAEDSKPNFQSNKSVFYTAVFHWPVP